MRFSDDQDDNQHMVDSEIADTTEAHDGSAHGDAALGHKRKRDIEDEAGRGMDIDAVGEVGSPSGGAHGAAAGGDEMESIGGLLSRISMVDPEIEQWAKKINDQYDLDNHDEQECLSKNRVFFASQSSHP